MLATAWVTVAVRSAAFTRSSSIPVTFTVCAVFQLSAVKVSAPDSGATDTVATLSSPLDGVTVTAADGLVFRVTP